ncbi:MAG: formyltransferase family protein [Vicinamibacterales bacterium]
MAGIVFFGCTDTGWDCCQALLDGGVPIAGIVTMPEEFRISWAPGPVRNVRHRDLAPLARRHGVPVLDGTDAGRRPDFREALRRLEPDLLVVVGWFHMIGRSLRAQARLGAVGVHASLLPKYRGGAPLVWAIINGERETGVSLFHFADGVDDGDIVAQARIPIGPDDTIAEVVARANVAAVGLAARHVPGILAGTAPRMRQAEAEATRVPQRSPADGQFDWVALPSATVHNWVRAQTHPYPGAFTSVDGLAVRVWRTRLPREFPETNRPGAHGAGAAGWRVWCGDARPLEFTEASIDGSPSMTGPALVEAMAAKLGTQAPTRTP